MQKITQTINFIISLVLGFCFISCNASVSHKPIEVIKEISESRQDEYMKLVKFDIEKSLNLVNLEKGFDSIELRLWFSNSTLNEKLVVIQKANNQSKISAYNLIFKYHDSTGLLESIEKSQFMLDEKGSSDKILKDVINMGILTLPDMSEIPNYSRTFDGVNITIEYATIDHYKIYSYQNPHIESNSFWQVKAIVEIIRYLEEQLKLNLLPSEKDI